MGESLKGPPCARLCGLVRGDQRSAFALPFRRAFTRPRSASRARVASMVALGSDLDHIGARYAVERLAGEYDERFRKRVALAPEALSVAGPIGAYQFHALTADLNIHDVSVISDRPGRVIVTIMMRGENPVPDAAMLLKVRRVINSSVVRPLTDEVGVTGPQTVLTDVSVRLSLYPGPDATLVGTKARNALINRTHLLGYDLKKSAIYAAAHQEASHRQARACLDLIEPGVEIGLGLGHRLRCILDRGALVLQRPAGAGDPRSWRKRPRRPSPGGRGDRRSRDRRRGPRPCRARHSRPADRAPIRRGVALCLQLVIVHDFPPAELTIKPNTNAARVPITAAPDRMAFLESPFRWCSGVDLRRTLPNCTPPAMQANAISVIAKEPTAAPHLRP